jgi:hypothetical protein
VKLLVVELMPGAIHTEDLDLVVAVEVGAPKARSPSGSPHSPFGGRAAVSQASGSGSLKVDAA